MGAVYTRDAASELVVGSLSEKRLIVAAAVKIATRIDALDELVIGRYVVKASRFSLSSLV